MTLTTVTLLAALTLGNSASAPLPSSRNLFQEIDARHARGELDTAKWHLYRVAAIKRPDLLPADLRVLGDQTVIPSGTRYLVEAFQYVVRNGILDGVLHDLLAPPDGHEDFPYTVDSSNWPIRVSYENASQATLAQTMVTMADLAYDRQVTDHGFYPPAIEPGYSPYRIYIASAGGGNTMAYTSPYGVNPDTLYYSCFTYIVVDPTYASEVGSTLAHEISHSMQATMDCGESTTWWENTAVYMEGATNADWTERTYPYIGSFQAEPWRSLDWFASGELYPYGGVLWAYFLADRFAPEDGPVFVRQVWEACMQNSNTNNEPDYFDAIEAVAAARGAEDPSMEAIYTDFAEARYFVGNKDDGQHMTGADVYNAVPAVSAAYRLTDLPVREATPPQGERPAGFGTNFITVDLSAGSTRPIVVTVDGNANCRWAGRAVLTGAGKDTLSVPLVFDGSSAYGTAQVDPTGFDQLLVVVVNLGPDNYDPDQRAWLGVDYYYSIEPVADPPTITAIYPSAVLRGQQNLHLRLEGTNIAYGPSFAVAFAAQGISVLSIDSVSSTEVLLTITVPALTAEGPTDVTLTSGRGQQTTASDLFFVFDEFDTMNPGPKPKGCQTGGPSGPWGPLLVFLALVFLALVRRRRQG